MKEKFLQIACVVFGTNALILFPIIGIPIEDIHKKYNLGEDIWFIEVSWAVIFGFMFSLIFSVICFKKKKKKIPKIYFAFGISLFILFYLTNYFNH